VRAHVCVFNRRLNRCTTNICNCDEKFALHLTCDGVENKGSCIGQQGVRGAGGDSILKAVKIR